MLLLKKPGTGVNGVPPRLRTVCDLRERNANTHKVTSPLPDMEGILRRASRHRYRSLIDGKDAYEQICVDPAHVDRMAMTTPDGNMVSLVLQQGDCNAVATYQSLMNHLFGPYISVWMDVYLDDIVIYSDTLTEHIDHVKAVIDILKKETLYLSLSKLHFLCQEMKILGRIVNAEGVRMDPSKVDSVLAWKAPTSKELLRGFLGSVGYLADDIAMVRIPMGILTALTGSEASFKWDYTHQRAFDEIKRLVHAHRTHHRVPLEYSSGAPPIWLVTDGSHGGVAGVVSQGENFKTAKVAAFFSAKLTSAQMNYPVHEIEMLAGVESMLRHRDILLGCKFTWLTDHKGLVHLLGQRNLSGRQARWMEKIAEYDYEVQYVPGVENVLADALSRIYSNDSPRTVRAASEYTQYADESGFSSRISAQAISMPVYAGIEAFAVRHESNTEGVAQPLRRSARVAAVSRADTPILTTHSVHQPVAQKAQVHPPTVAMRSAPLSVTQDVEEAPPTVIATSSETTLVPARGVRRERRGPVSAPAESGRPETSREFAKRIHRVILHGPRDGRQEGAKGRSPSPLSPAPAPAPAANWADEVEGELYTQDATPPSHGSKQAAPLLEYISQATDGVDLPNELRGKYRDDILFARVIEQPSHHKNFVYNDGLLFLKEKGNTLLCIPDVRLGERSARELVIRHAHTLLAHLGPSKTLGFLRDHVWWKTMTGDVQKYCDSCMTCKRSKPANQKPYGLLNPLPVPAKPWEAIGMDFVGPLPDSKDRNGSFDSITVIIDLLTGTVHLVPSRITYTTRNIAELVFAEVYKHHGMPKAIVSDRDVLFTSQFWTHLHRLLGVELRMSSAYHPQSDGSTERANRTVTQMLRQCISPGQKDWVSKLPGIEFAINSACSDSTGYAPFFLNHGRMPRPMIWDNPRSDEYPGVRAYAQKVKQAVMATHDSIIAARVKQTRDANRRRRPAPFTKDDLVYVSTRNISLPKGLARKLVPKYIGPYRIINDFDNNSYQLELPRNLKRRGIHDVFHSSLLRVHEPNDDRLFPGRLDSQVADLEDKDEEWAIDRIDSHLGSGRDALFEAVWKSGDRTWVPYESISHLAAVNTYLEALGVETVSQLKSDPSAEPLDPQIFVGASFIQQGHQRRYSQAHRRKGEVHPSRAPQLDDSPTRSVPLVASSVMAPPSPEPLGNRYVDFSGRQQNRRMRVRDPTHHIIHLYTIDSFRDFILFDSRLRRKDATQISWDTEIPGGYAAFAALWNQDANASHHFCEVDLEEEGAVTLTGSGFDPNHLDFYAPPIPPRVVECESTRLAMQDNRVSLQMAQMIMNDRLRADSARTRAEEEKKRKREEAFIRQEQEDEAEREEVRRRRKSRKAKASRRRQSCSLSPPRARETTHSIPRLSRTRSPRSDKPSSSRTMIAGPGGEVSDFEDFDEAARITTLESCVTVAPVLAPVSPSEESSAVGVKGAMDTSA